MAAELVGTAYVRIRAITTGLAKDISDGVDRGVKDAGPDVQKSGEGLGDDLGEGTGKGFGKSFKGTVSDGVADEVDSPDIHRTAEKGGSSIAKDVRSGIEDENKRKNPFASLLQSFRNIRRDKDNFDLDVDFGIPDIDLPNLFKGLGDDAEEGGEGIGDRVTDGIEKSHKKRNPFASLGESLANIDLPAPIKWAGIFGPTTLAPIIGTILAGLALVSEALGFIVLAAAGAGVALAGIAAVAMPGLAVLFAAFKADTPIMKKFKEEVKDLLKPWKEVAEETQRRMIPGLREAARTLMGNDGLVALFKDFGGNIGQVVGDMAHYASAVLTSSKNMDALATILSASSDFFVNIRDAAVSFIDALLPFLAAAAPLAVQFSEALAGWAAHFQEFINRSSETGELTATFQGWYDKLTVVVDILGNVFSLLWSVLSIAGETGTPFFDRIAEATQGWSDWAKSTDGQNRIKQFFLDAQPVIDEIFRLIGNVWDLIVQPATSDGGATMFSNLAGALDMLNDVLENPVTATVVPYLLGLATALGLLSLVPAPLLTGLGSAVDILARALGNLATTIGGLLIKALAELSIALLTTPAGWVLLAIAAAALAVYLAFQHWDEVTAALQSAWEWFTKLSTPLKIAVGLLGVFAIMVVPLVAPILAFAAAVLAVTWALKNWETVLGVVTAVKDAIVGFVTGLPAMIGALPGQLLSVGTAIVNFFKELPSTIGDALSGLGEILRVALLDAVRNAPTWLLDGLDALYQAGQELLGAVADGLAFALPNLAQFFVELPITILKAIGAIASTLIPIGLRIIGFILTGLVQAGPRILAWFIALPFEIATLMAKAGAALMTALAKGILDNKDRVFQFFLDLPANLLSMVITAATWLLQVGSDIIQGIWQGIQNNWHTVLDFFIGLPSAILGALSSLGGFLIDLGAQLMNGLWEGIQSVWASINEFFLGLPQAILTALGDLFTFIWNSLIPGAASMLANIGTWIAGVVDWFLGLPAKALGAIGDLGMTIWNAITGGFSTALTNVGKWVSDVWGKLTDFATQAPGKVAALVTSLPGKIGEATVAALTKITTWVTDGLSALSGFATDAVSKVAGLVTSLPGKIGEATSAALTKVKDWVDDALDAVGRFVTRLPSKLSGMAGDLAAGIGRLLKSAWNTAADAISVNIPLPFPFSGSIHVGLPHLAQGAVVPGTPMGTLAVIGEGGRTEAVVPMTKPQRALAVMREAGLDKLVLQAALKDGAIVANGPGGDVTMLHMEHATFVAPIDADVVIQKISSAYRRMAS